MTKIIRIVFIFLMLPSQFFLAQKKLSFKDYYNEAFAFLQVENYRAALPILLEMEKMDDKNYNTLFSIGFCHLKSTYDKDKAIAYFERILSNYKNLTIAYRAGDYREKKAPIETIKYMGQAYHYNYQFDEALEKYQEFKDILSPDNKEDMDLITRDIRVTNNAKRLMANPVKMKINPIESLNTQYSEYRPKLTGDEQLMYFTSRRQGGMSNETDLDNGYFEDVYVSQRNADGSWGIPELVKMPVNSESHDACLYVAPDNSHMVVYRADGTTSNQGAIFSSAREGDNWAELITIGDEVNSSYWETDVSMSADGNTMFFTSNRPGGFGGRDIWMMKRLPDGRWAKAQNLGGAINTQFDEESPYLHPDGKTLYFSSQGHNNMGGFDVFKSELQSDGSWGEPNNVGYPINTTGDDVFYYPSLDGKHAFFSSFRKDGKGEQDLYMLEFPEEEMRTLALYRGQAKYSTGEVITKLAIGINRTDKTEEYGSYRPNHKTGKFLFILPPGESFVVKYTVDDLVLIDTVRVPEKGGVFDVEKIVTIIDGKLVFITEDVLAQNIANKVVKESLDAKDVTKLNDNQIKDKLNAGESLALQLLFEYEKTTLIVNSKPDLKNLIKFMKDNPTAKIILEGHTDSKGELDYNDRLAKMRAEAIKNQLSQSGISKSRIKVISYGETKPIAANELPDGSDNPEGRQLNRRVEIRIDK
jgi:outer membrane protein OmpA-like peptidoglycan-associated protein